MKLGCAANGGYKAGERSDGITSLCTICNGVEASCLCRFCSIDGKGEEVADVGRGIGI